jgi:hypothetical protein
MDLFSSRTTRIVVATVLVVALVLLGFSAFL